MIPFHPSLLGISKFNRTMIEKSIDLRDGLPKKSSCSFGFCPNEGGGGPAQFFCPLFTNCIYWVNLGMGREGETPAQIFWHIGIIKSGTVCPN